MDPENGQERSEVFERIPWEMLDQKKSDHQKIVMAIAGAVVLGVLAYSFMTNRPQTEVAVVATPAVQAPAPTNAPAPPPPVPAAPVVVSEADLYAIDPERLVDQAIAHAEWFAIEYFALDGFQGPDGALGQLLPAGVPLPSAPDGTRVFVEWAGAITVRDLESLTYEVDVLVRYLAAGNGEEYRRQTPVVATVQVMLGDAGPQVLLPPSFAEFEIPPQHQLTLVEVPAEVAAAAVQIAGEGEVVGATSRHDGGWSVIVLVTDTNGIVRPVSVRVG